MMIRITNPKIIRHLNTYRFAYVLLGANHKSGRERANTKAGWVYVSDPIPYPNYYTTLPEAVGYSGLDSVEKWLKSTRGRYLHRIELPDFDNQPFEDSHKYSWNTAPEEGQHGNPEMVTRRKK